MLLMIDNYDSFTYNLVQYFGELGETVTTIRNQEPHFQLWQVPHQLVQPMAFPKPDRRDQPERQGHLRRQRRYSR